MNAFIAPVRETKLAQLIARQEGFGVSGAIPTVRHNPGDLTHAPHASHEGIEPDAVGIEPDDAEGWADLERQLQLYADRQMTLRAAIYAYAPPAENDTESYLDFICRGLGCAPDTPVSDALRIP